MRLSRWPIASAVVLVVACATAAPNVRPPLGAHLTASAMTGLPVPLRRDPNAKVVLSNAASLPPASFAPAQAERGAQVYDQTCGMCHSAEQHKGEAFVQNWNDRRVYDLYALVSGTMPLDKPGGLTQQQYVDVVAYLLQANHAAPGRDSLAADTVALRAHKIAVHFP